MSHLQEKLLSAKVSVQDVLSQARVLSTMETELRSRELEENASSDICTAMLASKIDSVSATSQLETMMKEFRKDIAVKCSTDDSICSKIYRL